MTITTTTITTGNGAG
ncbi:hypothetical protein [Kluyvera sichuanensis]